jgi:hypothetical protein
MDLFKPVECSNAMTDLPPLFCAFSAIVNWRKCVQ